MRYKPDGKTNSKCHRKVSGFILELSGHDYFLQDLFSFILRGHFKCSSESKSLCLVLRSNIRFVGRNSSTGNPLKESCVLERNILLLTVAKL